MQQALLQEKKTADLANILKLLSICPEKAKYMRQAIMAPIKKPETLSSNEALALLLDQNLTKEQSKKNNGIYILCTRW